MPFSFNFVLLLATTLLMVRNEAVGSIQTGLCGSRESGGATPSSSCVELEEGETCQNTSSHRSDWTNTCSEPQVDSNVINVPSGSCFDQDDRWTGDPCLPDADIHCNPEQGCVRDNEAEWADLQLDFTYIGLSQDRYAVDVRWKQPKNTTVPGYILVLASYNNGLTADTWRWDRCENHNRFKHTNICRRCVIHFDNTTFHYRLNLTNFRYRGSSRQRRSNYVKLIPSNWCDGPTLTIAPPVTCNHICPGNCQLCGSPKINLISPPRELLNYSVCRSKDSTFSATFNWESGIKYIRPNPTPIYYFFLTRNSDGLSGRFTRHIKTSQTPVTIYNLTLEEDQTYYINIQQYECECTSEEGFPFRISRDPQPCKDVSNPNPESVTSVSPTTTHSSSTLYVASGTTNPQITNTPLPLTIAPSLLTTTAAPRSNGTTSPKTANSSLPLITAVLGALLLVVVVLLIVVVLLKYVVCRSLKPPHMSPPQVSPKKEKLQVLVLYSWETPERNQQLILQSLSTLTLYADLVYSAKAHVRGNIPQWVEKHIQNCDKVLIVCNKEFSKEWQSPRDSHTDGAIVNAVKSIINGHVNDGSMDRICCKMALVFLKEKHKSLVPSRILHNLKQYVLYDADSEKQDELLRFVSDTPMFQFCHSDEVKSIA